MDNLTTRYREVVEYYNDNFAYFLTDVLSIGKPILGGTTDTACISWDPKNRKDMTFEFNPSFMDELDTENLAFVMAHEALHVVLNHPMVHNRLHKAWGVSATAPEFNKTFNIAADVIINDLLIDAGFEAIEDCFKGENIIGASSVGMSVTDVFNKLYHGQKSMDEVPGAAMDDHGWMQDPDAEELSKALNEALEEKGGDSLFDDVARAKNIEEGKLDKLEEDIRGKMAGDTAGELRKEFLEASDFSASWADILEKIEPEIFVSDYHGRAPVVSSFHARRRKLYGPAFKNIHLPVARPESRRQGDDTEKGKNLPLVVVALDVSGSVEKRDIKMFVNMADNIPQDKISVRACTFDTRYMPYNLDGKPYVTRGGTSFNAIPQFINNLIKNDPACKGKDYKDFYVIVLTDGCASMSDQNRAKFDFNNWHWVMPTSNSFNSTLFIFNDAGTPKENVYMSDDLLRQ